MRIVPLLLAVFFIACPPAGRALAAPLDTSLVKNDDPRALPRGLYFHSSLPIEHRRLLVEDLVWLGQLGPLKESDELAELLGVRRRPLTGAMLVAWLIERLVVISTMRAIGARSNGIPIIISGARPDMGLLLFDARKKDRDGRPIPWEEPDTEVPSEAFALAKYEARSLWKPNFNWRTADRAHEELDAWHIDDRLVIATEGAYANPATSRPSIYLTETLFRRYGNRRPSDRISRLSGLFHEARHLDGTHNGDVPGHFTCPKGPWAPAKFRDCDWYYAGAYGIDASLTRVLSKNCVDCTAFDLRNLKSDESGFWNHVPVRLLQPMTIPALPVFSDQPELAGTTVIAVPPRIYFTARTERLTLQSGRVDSLITRYSSNTPSPNSILAKELQVTAALTAWIGDLDRQGLIDPDQPKSRWSRVVNDDTSAERRARPDPDEANAVKWLDAVRGAEKDGYNVPLLWMPPCRKFRGSCSFGQPQDEGVGPAQEFAPQPPHAKPRSPGWLGVNVEAVDAAVVAEVYPFLRTTRGAIVTGVTPDGPAAKKGIVQGDIILEIEGVEVRNDRDLAQKVGAAGGGAEIELAYCKPNGEFGFKYIKLIARPANAAADVGVTGATPPAGSTGFNGITIWNGTDPQPQRPSVTYRVSANASGGVLNMRRGPGTRHKLVVGIPVGATGIKRGECRAADDSSSRKPWCKVEWRGFSGWASNCCLVAE